jgi:hypothetical protein
MPSVPLYVHRLASGLAALEALSTDWIDRRALEEALGVGKWTAWRIMRRCGASEGPGNTLVCQRQDLVARLRRLLEDGRFAPEIRRRERVERYLDGIASYAMGKHKEIARNRSAEALVSTRFANLPAGVELTPTELRISFTGTREFLERFGAVVFALQNDFEKIEALLSSSERVSGANQRGPSPNGMSPGPSESR